MAWPTCAACLQPVAVYDRAAETRVVMLDDDNERIPNFRHETEVFRSYSCACGWAALTVERVYCVNPETLRLRRKFLENGQPVVQTVSTEAR
jgi:hypothetical protein